ncbi:MAG: RlmE family RNA methyltransferase [Spirochaetaceae bacterium]|jgi:23S rRNA (uridine2552-2'-O)-methyltransferase|nr:RlmE family RNA methyltransferase [Spirochaetaceae bacterium]
MSCYNKPDFWALKARKEGYPARSVYKLREMDEKFGLFPRQSRRGAPFRALDLGASPGSWSLYALRRIGGAGFLAAVDLEPLALIKDFSNRKNFFFVQGDMTAPETQELLRSQGRYHLVMSDAAPETTGNSGVDAARSLALAESALEYGESALLGGGSLAVKVFQSKDAQKLLERMREHFAKVKIFKPQACRSQSVEIYYLGQNLARGAGG